MSERGLAVSSCAHLAIIPAESSQLPQFRFAPGSFGAIVAWHALEHVSEPDVMLRSLLESLARGGRLLLKVCNGDSWSALILGDRWAGFDIPRHPFLFRRRSIERLLEGCGYTVLRSSRCSGLGEAASLAASLCPRLDPRVRSMRGEGKARYATAARNLFFGALTAALLPFALLEAASGSGASIMLEACRAGEEHFGEPGARRGAVP